MHSRPSGRLAAVLSLCLALAWLSACSLLNDRDQRLQLAVTYATGKLIEQSSDITGAGVAAAVVRARAIVEADELVTVIDLTSRIRAALDLDQLGPADQLLVDALLMEVQREFVIRLGDGLLKPEDRTSILTFLQWVELAALLYG